MQDASAYEWIDLGDLGNSGAMELRKRVHEILVNRRVHGSLPIIIGGAIDERFEDFQITVIEQIESEPPTMSVADRNAYRSGKLFFVHGVTPNAGRLAAPVFEKPKTTDFRRFVLKPFAIRFVIMAVIVAFFAVGFVIAAESLATVKFAAYLSSTYLSLWFGDRTRRYLWSQKQIGRGKLVSLVSLFVFVVLSVLWWFNRH